LRDPVVIGAGALRFLMVLLSSKESVDAIASIDRSALKAAAGAQVADGDVLTFAYADGRAYSRMFPHPASGIVEDPATGSSVAPLCAALAGYGVLEPQTNEIVVEQGAKMGRRSLLHARFSQGAGTVSGVAVGGSSVYVLHGVLTL
jgi:PhzF family phenazine biosynthesis protein